MSHQNTLMDSAHCRVFGVCDFIPGNAGIGVQLRRPRPPEQPWVREHRAGIWHSVTSVTSVTMSHLSRCHSCHMGWGWAALWGLKHSVWEQHLRQALKAELAFVWWFEMESGTPRDKSKSFCIWQAPLWHTNNISLWTGAEGGLWDVIMVSSSPLPFLVHLSAFVTLQWYLTAETQRWL